MFRNNNSHRINIRKGGMLFRNRKVHATPMCPLIKNLIKQYKGRGLASDVTNQLVNRLHSGIPNRSKGKSVSFIRSLI